MWCTEMGNMWQCACVLSIQWVCVSHLHVKSSSQCTKQPILYIKYSILYIVILNEFDWNVFISFKKWETETAQKPYPYQWDWREKGHTSFTRSDMNRGHTPFTRTGMKRGHNSFTGADMKRGHASFTRTDMKRCHASFTRTDLHTGTERDIYSAKLVYRF